MTLGKLFFSLQGRIARRHYWAVICTYLVPYLIIYRSLIFADESGNAQLELIVTISIGLFALFYFWSLLAVQVKRFHDRDKSGWWVLISLVPIIGWLWLNIECGFLSGTHGQNRFGPPPN